ncbi:MAG: insulinase family protein [Acidobacteriia bacterium]|nr:insulinase family protein [Terriglobia bacterium]
MKLRSLGILMFLFFPGICYSQVRPRPSSQPATPPPFMQQLKSFDQDGSVTKVVLKNDLTVLVGEAHATPLIESLAWIKTGYGDDPADLPGISRVMEHMLSRGTATRTAAVMAADLKALGGEVSSSTEYDHTILRTVAPAPQWKRALEIQTDALLNSSLDPQELKRQIEVIRDESGRALADPEALADAKLLATGFAGGRLRRARWAAADVLNNITREKLVAFYRSAYSPARIVLVVCGDVTAAEVLNAVVNLYGNAKGGAAAESPTAAGDWTPGFHYAQVRPDVRLARVELGFRTVAVTSADYTALEVLRAMLGTGEGSIFNRRLKNQKGIIYGAAADLVAYGDTGYLGLRMELDPKDIDRCEIAAFTELEILKRQDADTGELERARAQLKREFWETSQTVSGRAERLARLESLGSWKGINTYLARLRQIKWADVKRVAARYLNLENCAVLESLPVQADARNASGEIIQSTIKQLLTASTEQEMAEREKITVPALDISEEAGSFVPSEVRYPFQTASILRGPDLFIREDHTMPLIHLGIFFAGGKLTEAKTNAGITSLMLRTMLRDSRTRSADQTYRQLEVYGAALIPVVEDDYFGFCLSILSANVEQGLDIISEIIKSPKLDPQEVARQKVLQTAALRHRSDMDLARLRLRGALFRDYSYALDPDGSEESIANITPDAVQAWHKLLVMDKKPMAVIIGDTEGTSLAGYFVHNFSGSRYQDVKLPEGFPKALEKKDVIEASWAGNASSVMMGFQAPPEEDEDSFPLMVLQSYASGSAGRLTGAIQDRLPGARRVSLEYEPELRGGTIMICILAAPADEEQALKVLTEELARLTTAPVLYRDYRAAVNSVIGAFQIRQQTRYRQIAEVIKSVLAGKEIEGFQDYINRLQDVKQTDLQEVAQRVFKIEKSVTLRMHGKSEP